MKLDKELEALIDALAPTEPAPPMPSEEEMMEAVDAMHLPTEGGRIYPDAFYEPGDYKDILRSLTNKERK